MIIAYYGCFYGFTAGILTSLRDMETPRFPSLVSLAAFRYGKTPVFPTPFPVRTPSRRQRKRKHISTFFFFGGEAGIRTLGTVSRTTR